MIAEVILGIVIGTGICGILAGFYLTLQAVRSMKQSVDELAKVARELLAEGSFTQIARSLQFFRNNAPEYFAGLQEFLRLMSMVSKAMFNQEAIGETKAPAKPQPVSTGESGFYPGVTDQEAAEHEAAREAGRHGITLSEEQLATYRTEGQQ